MLNELKEVFELATNTTSMIANIIKLTNSKKEIGNWAQIGSSGNEAQIGSSGNWAKIGSSGDRAKIGSSGDEAKIGSSGNEAKIGSSGNWAKIGSSGNWAKIGSSGNWAKIGSSGNGAKIGSSGNWAKIGSSGNGAQIGSSGNWAQIGSSGNWAQIGSSGNEAQIGSSGNWAQIGSSGDRAQIGSSGDRAQIIIDGNNTIVCGIGKDTIIKGKKGNWITLAEYDKNDKPICVKSAMIDGKILKANTWYILQNEQFKECICVDNIISILVKKHKNVYKVINLDETEESYIVKDGDIYSHGATIQEAKESLIYKISNRDTSKYADYTYDTELTLKEAIEMYRVITGACESGTKYFIENVLNNKKEKYTVKEVIELTIGQYNHDELVDFFNRGE